MLSFVLNTMFRVNNTQRWKPSDVPRYLNVWQRKTQESKISFIFDQHNIYVSFGTTRILQSSYVRLRILVNKWSKWLRSRLSIQSIIQMRFIYENTVFSQLCGVQIVWMNGRGERELGWMTEELEGTCISTIQTTGHSANLVNFVV